MLPSAPQVTMTAPFGAVNPFGGAGPAVVPAPQPFPQPFNFGSMGVALPAPQQPLGLPAPMQEGGAR